MNNDGAFSKTFNWFFGPEAKQAIEYYREIGVMVPFGVMVFFAFVWVLRIWGEV